MNKQAILLLMTLLAVGLAGCAGNSGDEQLAPGEEIVDKGTVDLTTTGAIAGLLVDDRYRPIDLEEKQAEGQYQAMGFILVQETGGRFRTNENGEFQILNLEPGTYTLRTSAEGHEAIPQKVRVVVGEFSETQILARRISSVGGLTITDEYSVFVPCVFTAVVLTFSPDCTFDQTGDTQRFAFYPNYMEIANIHLMITEMRLATPAGGLTGSWGVSVRDPGAVTNGIYYSEGELITGDYLKLMNPFGEISENGGRNTEWMNDKAFQIALFGQGLLRDSGVYPSGNWGPGAQVGQRATFIVTLFIGAPEVDVEEYCVLC